MCQEVCEKFKFKQIYNTVCPKKVHDFLYYITCILCVQHYFLRKKLLYHYTNNNNNNIIYSNNIYTNNNSNNKHAKTYLKVKLKNICSMVFISI